MHRRHTNFNSETLEADDQDIGASHLGLSVMAKHIQLPRIQSLIDLLVAKLHGSLALAIRLGVLGVSFLVSVAC